MTHNIFQEAKAMPVEWQAEADRDRGQGSGLAGTYNTLRGVPGMSAVAARTSVVTEPSAPSSRHAPKRPPAAIEDLDLLVKVTGRPDAIRAYTAAEQAEAEAYAAAVGGVIEPLPTKVS